MRKAERFFHQVHQTVKHDKKGLVCMANGGIPNTNASQFFFTLRGDDLAHLDGKHTIFGEVII
jgi:cyclophilin family peptidyl-prolyl cis-trans isomerase